MIKISSLTKSRRDGKAFFTYLDEETNEVKTEEIQISFLKPTEELVDELNAMEKAAYAEDSANEDAQKNLFCRQLARMELQTPFIVDDNGEQHKITLDEFKMLDFAQVSQLMAGMKSHFFLQTPQSKSETSTNSTSEHKES